MTHWMTSETRDGAPIPAMILRRWQWFHDNAQRARRGYMVEHDTPGQPHGDWRTACASYGWLAHGLRVAG